MGAEQARSQCGGGCRKKLTERESEQFWFFLARTVFHVPVRVLKQILGADEFTEWQAYFGIDPWGEEWLQTGTVAAMLYNANKKRTAKALTADDFVYRPLKKKKQSPEQMFSIFSQMAAALTQKHGK